MIKNPFDESACHLGDDPVCHTKYRDQWHLVLGPPGTGKTTRLLRHLEEEIEMVPPDQVAFMTFTRSARAEARSRAKHKLRLSEDALHWCRTIHSAAYELIGVESDGVLSQEDWKYFGELHGYEFSKLRQFRDDEDMGEVTISTPDDELAATLSWGRSRMLNPEDSIAASPFNVGIRDFLLFVKRYDAFRNEMGKIDFHDMLELALASDERPPVSVAIIDEAQDLSPLQVALVEKWFDPCDRVYVGGDDDQAIMAFQGGDPAWLLRLADECGTVTKLDLSYRVPALVHAMAKKIIARNVDRVEKPYWPTDNMGEIGTNDMVGALSAIDIEESTFVLARNWWILRDVAKLLAERGTPFWVEKHRSWSPLGKPSLMSAVAAAVALSRRRHATHLGFHHLIRLFPSKSKRHPNGLPRGVKKLAEENRDAINYETARRDWGLGALLDAIDRHGPVKAIPNLDKDLGFYLDQMIRQHGEIPRTKVTLTTIHSAKGREADTVILLSDVATASYLSQTQGSRQEQEGENRVAYVGVTRAKRRLLVVQPQSDKYYPYSSVVAAVQREGPRLRQPGEDDPDKTGY